MFGWVAAYVRKGIASLPLLFGTVKGAEALFTTYIFFVQSGKNSSSHVVSSLIKLATTSSFSFAFAFPFPFPFTFGAVLLLRLADCGASSSSSRADRVEKFTPKKNRIHRKMQIRV